MESESASCVDADNVGDIMSCISYLMLELQINKLLSSKQLRPCCGQQAVGCFGCRAAVDGFDA